MIESRVANKGLYKPDARDWISLTNISDLSNICYVLDLLDLLIGLVLFFPNQLILYHKIVVLSSFPQWGSAVQALEVLVDGCSVLEVVGIGLQLVSVMVLKPQVVACDVAEHFVPPTVAVAFNGVLAAVGVELVCSHDLPFVVCNICYVFGVLAGLFLFFPTSLYYTTKLWDCQIFRATGVTEVRYEIGGMLWVLGDNVTKNITQKSQ